MLDVELLWKLAINTRSVKVISHYAGICTETNNRFSLQKVCSPWETPLLGEFVLRKETGTELKRRYMSDIEANW